MAKRQGEQDNHRQPLTDAQREQVIRFMENVEQDQKQALKNGEIDPFLDLSKLVINSRNPKT